MIHRYRYESELERRERLDREAQGQRILTILLVCVLVCVLAAGIWLLLRTVAERGGWMAIF